MHAHSSNAYILVLCVIVKCEFTIYVNVLLGVLIMVYSNLH